MADAELRFSAVVWVYPGKGGWRFVTLPDSVADAVRLAAQPRGRGWPSQRVVATIGATSWPTSVFPDGRADSWSLPIKSEVRRRERVVDGQTVEIALTVGGAADSSPRAGKRRSAVVQER